MPYNAVRCMKTSDPAADFEITLQIPDDLKGRRADQVLAALMTNYSRATIQGWIRSGRVRLGRRPLKSSERLSVTGPVHVSIPPVEPAEWLAENIPLEVLYEDVHLLVLNKPAGLVVHPGAGNPTGTLLNGLLALDDALRCLPRAGIVQRLDKETSGLMVVARTETARQHLIGQLSARQVVRGYLAIATGVPVSGITLNEPIGRHPVDRRRMAVSTHGKPAVTHIRILEKYRAHALVDARLETGRTHQIRVHMAWWGYPLAGDPAYGGRARLPKGVHPKLTERLRGFRRQALHATVLSLTHPVTGQALSWQQAPPEDFQQLVTTLEHDRDTAGLD